ncbi:hypothetical protein FQA47_010513 [Oryzias melastigma]|uniref:Ig-like domain-containing protein n=1 Tax=Oryzias melastigma TaxID=30732 RepID=A0A834F2R9_ORYME|nr:hypothetical protein FQA47_010513 [Oryzias melastigma]
MKQTGGCGRCPCFAQKTLFSNPLIDMTPTVSTVTSVQTCEETTPDLIMSHLLWVVFLLYAAGCYPSSSSSPGPSSLLVIQRGQNVSLSCNLSSSIEITWYLLRSEQLLPLLTQRPSKVSGGDTADVHSGNTRLGWAGAVESGQVSLEIKEVEDEDAGLYFCAGRLEASKHVNGGIQLTVSGINGKEPIRDKGQPRWTLRVWVLTALLFLCFVVLVGFCLRSGKPACCCDLLKWNDRPAGNKGGVSALFQPEACRKTSPC